MYLKKISSFCCAVRSVFQFPLYKSPFVPAGLTAPSSGLPRIYGSLDTLLKTAVLYRGWFRMRNLPVESLSPVPFGFSWCGSWVSPCPAGLPGSALGRVPSSRDPQRVQARRFGSLFADTSQRALGQLSCHQSSCPRPPSLSSCTRSAVCPPAPGSAQTEVVPSLNEDEDPYRSKYC